MHGCLVSILLKFLFHLVVKLDNEFCLILKEIKLYYWLKYVLLV